MVLSVVIPCYNVEAYLDKCLTSLCVGSLRGKLEALIVNDGSIDGTRSIAQAYAEREPAIFRLIDKENGGHGSAVNAGIDAACGKYLRVVDGDDWLDTENLPALIEQLESSEADLVIDQKYEVSRETGKTVFFPLPDGTPFGRTLPFSSFCGDGMTEYYMLHTISARLDFLRALNVRLLEHTFYVDFEYVLKVTSRADTIEFAPLGMYHYLVGNAAQSVAPMNYVRRADQHRRVLDECLRFLHEASLTPHGRAYARRRCQLLIHTHLNILLIYDPDRRQGLKKARLFMKALRASDAGLHRLVRRRYALCLILHFAGFNAESIARLKGGH